MAVIKELYKSALGLPVNSYQIAGVEALHIVAPVLMTNGDGAGSIYKIAKIPASYIPYGGTINCEAITGATSCLLGFYETNAHGGLIIGTGNQLVAAQDLSSALVLGSGVDALKSIGTLNLGVPLYKLLGFGAGERQAFVLALTTTNAPTATKSALVRLTFVNGS